MCCRNGFGYSRYPTSGDLGVSDRRLVLRSQPQHFHQYLPPVPMVVLPGFSTDSAFSKCI